MTSEEVGIGWFARAVGDQECKPEDIPDFDALWQAASPGTEFDAMGCGTFRKMSGPAQTYIVDAVRQTLQDADVPPADIGHLVLATSDPILALLPRDLAIGVLDAARLADCVPHLLSSQRCCGSLTALRHGRQLFCDPDVTHVVIVALDFTPGRPRSHTFVCPVRRCGRQLSAHPARSGAGPACLVRDPR